LADVLISKKIHITAENAVNDAEEIKVVKQAYASVQQAIPYVEIFASIPKLTPITVEHATILAQRESFAKRENA